MLASRTKPDMAVVQKKLSAVLLGRNWIIVDLLDDLRVGHVDFKAPRRPAICSHLSAHNQGRFLTKTLECFEKFGRHCVLQHDALHDAGSIPQLRKEDLAAGTDVV